VHPQIPALGKAPALVHMPLQINIEKIFVNTGLTKKPLSPHPLPADCRLITAKLAGSTSAANEPLIIINNPQRVEVNHDKSAIATLTTDPGFASLCHLRHAGGTIRETDKIHSNRQMKSFPQTVLRHSPVQLGETLTDTGHTAAPERGWAAKASDTAQAEIPSRWHSMHRMAIAIARLLHGKNSDGRLTILASLLA
jgi:hypothetical protein